MGIYEVYYEEHYEGQTEAVSEKHAINNVRYANYKCTTNNDGFTAVLIKETVRDKVSKSICKNCVYCVTKSYIPSKVFCNINNLQPRKMSDTCESFKKNDSRRD